MNYPLLHKKQAFSYSKLKTFDIIQPQNCKTIFSRYLIEKDVKIEQSKINNLNFNIGIGKEIQEKLNYQEQI